MRVAQEPAFVLHHTDYSETSLLLEVFTRTHGKLALLAKGARRPKSPLRTTLIPFQPLVIAFAGRGEVPVLTSAEPAGVAPELPGSLMVCGLYLNELLQRLLHRHDPHERLFDHYAQALERLAASAAPEPVLRVFEKRLLEETGYGLVLEHEAESTAAIDPAARYRYLADRGPVPYTPQGEGVVVQGETLRALANEAVTSETQLHEAKQLLRALLARQLGDRPLASRELLRAARPRHALE
jgi:DNA repair protein RecO (recombination protein O)